MMSCFTDLGRLIFFFLQRIKSKLCISGCGQPRKLPHGNAMTADQ